MFIANENLNRVKDAFTDLLEENKISMDIESPFYNAYDYKGEIIFSSGYNNPRKADEFADQSYFSEILKNGGEFQTQFLGTLDCTRAYIDK